MSEYLITVSNDEGCPVRPNLKSYQSIASARKGAVQELKRTGFKFAHVHCLSKKEPYMGKVFLNWQGKGVWTDGSYYAWMIDSNGKLQGKEVYYIR